MPSRFQWVSSSHQVNFPCLSNSATTRAENGDFSKAIARHFHGIERAYRDMRLNRIGADLASPRGPCNVQGNIAFLNGVQLADIDSDPTIAVIEKTALTPWKQVVGDCT